ncbi:hypothetical protein LCGC14_2767550, partial [marine sediment metagenome]
MIVDKTTRLNVMLTQVELDLYRLRVGETRYLDTLIDDVEAVRRLLDDIGRLYVVQWPETQGPYQSLLERYPVFEGKVSSLATAQDADFARQYTVEALSQAVAMHENVSRINRRAHEHAQREQVALTDRLRWLILGGALGGVFI